MARKWPMPENTGSSAYMEHRGPTRRGEMTDQQLAEALDVSVPHAHEMIEGVTEHRTTDLDGED